MSTGTAFIGSLAGCSESGDGSEGGMTVTTSAKSGNSRKTPEKSQLETTKLASPFYPVVPQTVPFQIAIEEGIYEKHGISIQDVTSFSGGGTTVRGIVTGGIGMGGTALPALVKGYLGGAPIYCSGLQAAYPAIDFHVKPDSPIESIQDCKGKTIAVSNPGSSSEALAIRSIKKADGISPKDVNIMNAGGLGESITAMQEGQAEVTWNILPKSTVMLKKGQSRRVWWSRDFAPNVTELALAVGGNIKQNNPELAKKLIRAQTESFDWVQNNVTEAGEIWAQNADLPKDIAIEALQSSKPEKMFQISPKTEILTATGETMIEQGMVDTQPPWKEIIWQDPLPEDKHVQL